MINKILEKSAASGPNYAPTPFWAAATEKLLPALAADRIGDFRREAGPLSFFVPTFGYPANGLTLQQTEAMDAIADAATAKQAALLKNWVSGKAHAEADFRVFAASPANQHLGAFSESAIGNPAEQFSFDERQYSRSALNYLLGLCFLSRHTDIAAITTVLEIGGGFGTLGEILSQTSGGGEFRYVDLDIPPTCLFAEHYLKHACPEHFGGAVEDYVSGDDPIEIDALSPLSVLPNWAIERLSGSIDLFVNFISFQEMEPHVVQNYLDHVDRLAPKWILLRNLREGKQRRSASNLVGVDEPVLSEFYLEALSKTYDCVDADAQVFGYTTSDNFHSELLVFRRRHTG